MKSKHDSTSDRTSTKKADKANLTDAEIRRRLKNISEWRKKRLAKPHTKDSN